MSIKFYRKSIKNFNINITNANDSYQIFEWKHYYFYIYKLSCYNNLSFNYKLLIINVYIFNNILAI